MSYYGPSSPNPGQPGPHQSGSYGWNQQGGYPQQPQYPPPGSAPYMPVAQPGTLPLRPLGLGDYFNSMFATLRKSPGLFFGAALIFGGLAAILSATGEFLLSRAFTNSLMDPYAQLDQLDQAFAGFGLGFLGTVLLSQVVMVVGQVFSWGMYSTMVARGAIGMSTSLSQGFRLLRGQWGRLIVLLLLVAAGIVVLWLVFALLTLLVVGVMFAGGEPEGGAIVLAILAILAVLIIPVVVGLYFMIRWYLVVPAIVIENQGVFAGLRRSWNLTRGHFWRTLGITLLFGLILGIVASVIVSPLSFISGFILTSAGTEAQLNTGMLITNMIITAVSTLAGFVITNMALLVAIFFYHDYRFRKEGLHLEFQQLAAQHSSASTTDRFDTSPEQRQSGTETEHDLIPGRHSVGLQPGPPPNFGQPGPPSAGPYPGTYPGPYGQQPPQPPQGPPQPPGPYQ